MQHGHADWLTACWWSVWRSVWAQVGVTLIWSFLKEHWDFTEVLFLTFVLYNNNNNNNKYSCNYLGSSALRPLWHGCSTLYIASKSLAYATKSSLWATEWWLLLATILRFYSPVCELEAKYISLAQIYFNSPNTMTERFRASLSVKRSVLFFIFFSVHLNGCAAHLCLTYRKL